ncbi:MAG: AAA family ATPase [Desulfomonilaceae bacterium]|nr:AAA family ATPase [Desulfomonilaceae bacterium]
MILSKMQSLLSGRTSLIYLVSEEEERVERLILAAVDKTFSEKPKFFRWSCLHGLTLAGKAVDNTRDPVAAMSGFLRIKEPAVLIFKDLHLFLNGNPQLMRQLKDSARILRAGKNKIFFVSPRRNLPDELLSVFKIMDIPLPRYEEISSILDRCIAETANGDSVRESLTLDLKEKLVRAALGFTGTEAMDAFHNALLNTKRVTGQTVEAVLEEKQALVEQSGVLEFVSQRAGSWEIGGLVNLKKWLKERGRAFSPQAAREGLTPKGILVMGVSGCGKSLCIKAIANYWKLPLLRLDMGRIYDGLAGPPEEAMRKAIKTSEALAPCVLWIDEIEAGIANQKQKAGGGAEARVLALFLTWMQEKTAAVFVGATANEVEVLPPEILRKGRFDELFYMGLPLKEERKQILTIHMRKRRVDPSKFDMDYLAASTEGLNGAEIEQGVISAVYESSSNKTEVTEHILANALRNIVPLSRTMRERIEKIEAWARDRAMKASLETI